MVTGELFPYNVSKVNSKADDIDSHLRILQSTCSGLLAATATMLHLAEYTESDFFVNRYKGISHLFDSLFPSTAAQRMDPR